MVDSPRCCYRPGFIIKLLETYQQRFTISTIPSYYLIKHCYREVVLMKILIAEFASHWKVLENTHRLLEKNAKKIETTLFINEQGTEKNLIPLLFKDAKNANWKIHRFHSSTYFMHLLLIGFKENR